MKEFYCIVKFPDVGIVGILLAGAVDYQSALRYYKRLGIKNVEFKGVVDSECYHLILGSLEVK